MRRRNTTQPPTTRTTGELSPWFVAQITDDLTGGEYAFVEVWHTADGWIEKDGGRYGSAENPGVALDGATFAVDDYALCRSSDGDGGLFWELTPLVGGASSASAWKEPVRVATTANGTLSTAFANGQTVDGVTLATGDRILLKDQTDTTQNGIYTVNASGAPTRATDANTGALLLGATVAVTEGTANADTVWICTANATITVGSTSLPWRRFGDVSGPSSATDNAIARFDTTTGKLIQNSNATVNDAGQLTCIGVSCPTGNISVPNGTVSSQGVTNTLGGATYTSLGTGNLHYENSDAMWADIALNTLSDSLYVQVSTDGGTTKDGRFLLIGAAYAIGSSALSYSVGVSGTMPDGSVVNGGIVTSIGSGGSGSGTVTSVAATAPAAGFAISGSPITASGTFVFTLANDLAALEGLSGTNTIYYRSGVDTWSEVTIGSNLSFSGGTLSATGGGVTDHGALTGLSGDDHSQYALLAGRSNQQLYGSTGSGGSLGLIGTSHATKGPVVIEGGSWFQLGELGAAPSTAANYVCVYALTSDGHLYAKTDDGNARRLTLPVELGTVTTGTWQATAIGAGYGGTGQTTYTIGDFLYATASTTLSKLAPNTGGTKQFLSMTSSAPSWGALAAADYPTFVAAGGSAAKGAVPAPNSTAKPNQPRLLGDDGNWIQHAGKVLGRSYVATSETTTSVTPVDLTTTQHITFTLDEVSDVIIIATCTANSSTAGSIPIIYADVDGTDTEIARSTSRTASDNYQLAGIYVATSLSAASHTIKLQFARSAGTATFVRRQIVVLKG